jgi:endonuclease V-like protein UPF0215 family
MKSLEEVLRLGRTIRVLGVDDAPFEHERGARANFSGILCAGTRFEGMLWGDIEVDGEDATEALIQAIKPSKFYEQIHVVLIDGLAMGGFNLVDLPRLAHVFDRPCVAVMRKLPDMPRIERALRNFDDFERRMDLIERAGEIHEHDPFVFQCVGAPPDVVAQALATLTDQGHVPEALRLAHLIGSAIKTGSSSNRA